MLVDTLNCEGS